MCKPGAQPPSALCGQEGFPNFSSKKFKELPELLVQPQLADVRTVVALQDKEVVPLVITKLRIRVVGRMLSTAIS